MSHRSTSIDITGVWQPLSAVLTSIAANTGTAADKGIYYTAAATAAEFDLTAAGRALVDDADATAQRVTMGVVIGTDVQAYDATLQSISALGTAADKMLYTTNTDVWAESAITSAGRAILDDADASAQRTTIGLGTMKQTGFKEWTGAGSYYTVTGTDFTLDRPGGGWINSADVTWAGAQTVSSLSAGNTHYIYIDSAGTIGSTTTRSLALFQDNIILFEVLVDSDTPANVIVVKENHALRVNPMVMEFAHDIGLHGFNVSELASGGVISLNGTLGIQVDGATEWHDSDLVTTVPDSSSAAIDSLICHTDGAGKWINSATQNTVPTQYNNAGTPTNLTGNQRAIHCEWATKDDIEVANAKYVLVMGDVLYASLAAARAALALNQFTIPTNELLALEMVRMGHVIVSATAIDEIHSSKQTIGTGSSSSTGTSANLISLDTTNFDCWASAVDTTVQAFAETIDDIGKDGNFSIRNSADLTKILNFVCSGIATSTTRTITMANQNIDLTPTTGSYQASDATLTSISALGTAADKMLYTTNTDVWAESALTSAGRAILDDADATAQRVTLGLVIGTNVQAYDATLTSIAALGTAADKMLYTTNTDVWAESALTSAGRAILDDATASDQRTTLGLTIGTNVQAYDATLTSIAALGTAADKMLYTTNTDVWAESALTSAGRAILDDADATAQRVTLGLVIGTNVQAYDADLTAIAALASTDSNFIVGSGAGWVAESGATARTSLGLGTIATQASNNVSITGGSVTGITDLVVADGGSGRGTATAYAVIVGGTTATGAHQSVADVGDLGDVLTSGGAGTKPTFEAPAGGGGSLVYISTTTANADATIDFTGLNEAGASYKFILSNIRPANDGTSLYIRMSDDNGSTFEAGATDYQWALSGYKTGAPVDSADNSDSEIVACTSAGNQAVESCSSEITLIVPQNSTSNTAIVGVTTFGDTSGAIGTTVVGGAYRTAVAIDGLQFLYSAGNIADGTITLYKIAGS